MCEVQVTDSWRESAGFFLSSVLLPSFLPSTPPPPVCAVMESTMANGRCHIMRWREETQSQRDQGWLCKKGKKKWSWMRIKSCWHTQRLYVPFCRFSFFFCLYFQALVCFLSLSLFLLRRLIPSEAARSIVKHGASQNWPLPGRRCDFQEHGDCLFPTTSEDLEVKTQITGFTNVKPQRKKEEEEEERQSRSQVVVQLRRHTLHEMCRVWRAIWK